MDQEKDTKKPCEASQSVYPPPRWDAELMSLSEMEEKAQELRREHQRYLSETSQK